MSNINRFYDALDNEPSDYTPKKPSVDQVRAVGMALPKGSHFITPNQQIAWFGGYIFHKEVRWDNGVFVCGDDRLTPAQIVSRVRQ